MTGQKSLCLCAFFLPDLHCMLRRETEQNTKVASSKLLFDTPPSREDFVTSPDIRGENNSTGQKNTAEPKIGPK